ncbi:MAG: carboxypeptidase-like regulatory domain-containing protein [Planctomycetota bacterium]|nr:carboxypeptidase-like regulatory domain-containing protein [Planctomycetota bacterium]
MDRGPVPLILLLLGLAIAVGLLLLGGGEPEPGPIDGPPVEDREGESMAADPDLQPNAPTLEGVGDDEPASEPAIPPLPQPDGVLFTGMVIDAERAPAPGATIEVVTDDGPGPKATSDDQGRFSFRMVVTDEMAKTWGTVRARGSDGTVGWAALAFASRSGPGQPTKKVEGEAKAGTIVLRPAHAFDVEVSSRCAGALPATLWLLNAQWGVGPPWIQLQTDAAGRATIEDVPPGRWRLVGASTGCGRAWTLVQLPREDSEPVELELPDAHSVTITVRDAADEAPIAGAAVEVSEQVVMPDYYTRGPLVSAPSTYTTDAEGIARIDGLGGTETLYLRASKAGYPGGSEHTRGRGRGPGEGVLKPGTAEITLELHGPKTIRWPLEDKGHGIPPDGTEVTLKPWTNTGRLTVPEKGVIENGELVVDGWGPDGASGYAYAPGGLVARLSARPKADEGYPTAFYPVRQIEVVVRMSDGTPAKGWYLVVRDGGNNAVAPDVITDAEGRAVMKDLYSGPGSLVNVSISDTGGYSGYSKPLGSVNLQQEDGRFEVVIPSERTIHVRATVRGTAPSELFGVKPQINHRIAEPTEESGVPGLWILKHRPIQPEGILRVSIASSKYLAEPVQVQLKDATDPIEVTVDLQPAAALNVRVKEPSDKRYKVVLQRFDEETSSWPAGNAGRGFGMGSSRRADPNGILAFKMLAPGRYRAMDSQTGITSAGVDVAPTDTPAQVEIDLSKAGWVKGRVEVPDGVSFSGLSVAEADAKPSSGGGFSAFGSASLPGRPVNPKDGTFWVRIPGTRPVTLRVYGTLLRPHPTKGQVTVTDPKEGVVLVAERGAVATLRFDKPARVFMNRGQARPIAVHLYKGAVDGEGTKVSGMLDAAHTKVEIGGYEPGTWTLWLDAPGYAPVVLKDVRLGDGDTDLGEVALEDGATLRIDVKVKDGQSPPRLSVWLTKLDAPVYTRNLDQAGETLRLQGIGAGRFRLNVSAYSGAAPGINEELEFDGTTEVVREIDAR